MNTNLKGNRSRHFRILACVLPILAFIAAAVPGPPSLAQQIGPSGLPVPRFVSLRVNEVNMRRGPSGEHAIEWVYRNYEGLPVQVIAEAELWRKVRDHEGVEGWVHKTLLQADRMAIVRGRAATAVRVRPTENGEVLAYAKPGAMGAIKECRNRWCRVDFEVVEGWLTQRRIWGVFADEVIE